MKFTAGKMAVTVVAMGMATLGALGGCASIESVVDARDAAGAADQHAGAARARADDAYGIGRDARAIGNNALSSAQQANDKADATAAELDKLNERVSNLENRSTTHKKKARRRAPALPPIGESKPNNS